MGRRRGREKERWRDGVKENRGGARRRGEEEKITGQWRGIGEVGGRW